MLKYIADKEHYNEVLLRCEGVKHDLWIGTADLKDLYVARGKDAEPFLAVLDRLLKRGVEVRLLHAKEPGENFRLTDDPVLVDAAADHLEGVWQGQCCAGCRHKHFCGDRIDS